MNNFVPASPLERFVAALIDGIAASIPSIILSSISARLGIIGYIVQLAYIFTKDTIPQLEGQSIGKKVMKIQVIDEETGQRITGDYAKGVIRCISLIIPLFGFVDALMVFSSERKRFGDKWAKTMVVKQ
jgi:uncharacterized RDD family membrane protein YckC